MTVAGEAMPSVVGSVALQQNYCSIFGAGLVPGKHPHGLWPPNRALHSFPASFITLHALTQNASYCLSFS